MQTSHKKETDEFLISLQKYKQISKCDDKNNNSCINEVNKQQNSQPVALYFIHNPESLYISCLK